MQDETVQLRVRVLGLESEVRKMSSVIRAMSKELTKNKETPKHLRDVAAEYLKVFPDS